MHNIELITQPTETVRQILWLFVLSHLFVH